MRSELIPGAAVQAFAAAVSLIGQGWLPPDEEIREALAAAYPHLLGAEVVDADVVALFRRTVGEAFDAPVPLEERDQRLRGHRDAAIAAGLRAVLDGWAGRG